jgi:hypothetical protein
MRLCKAVVVVVLLSASGCTTLHRARLLEWGADMLDPGGAKVEAEVQK